MPLRDPEARKAWQQAYYRRNQEKLKSASRKFYAENREHQRALVRAYKEAHREEYLDYWRKRTRSLPKGPDRALDDLKIQIIYTLRHRAIRRGIVFDLTIDDLEIPTLCPVFGVKLECGRGAAQQNSPSVDRIDPSQGYVRGNIQIISNLANAMKQNATREQLEMFARWILREE